MEMEIQRKEFFCYRAGLRIRGVQYLPEGFDSRNTYPAVIVSHGFTGNYRSCEQFGASLAGAGWVTFCFSFCGGSAEADAEELKSDGSTVEATLFTQVEDLHTVMVCARQLEYVDEKRIVLLGISQGGFVSGMAAARYGDEVSKLIMIHPALCIPDHARRGRLGGAVYDPENVPEVIDCGRILLGRVFHDTVVEMDPFLELVGYKGPVLILQGTEDDVVDYSYALRARHEYAEGQCTLQLIRAMYHGLNESQFAGAMVSIRQFLSENEEVLAVRVIVTRSEETAEEGIPVTRVYFTGYCDGPLFRGVVEGEGCDRQEHCPDGSRRLRAEYTLAGMDAEGAFCRIHIVNQWGDGEWTPVITTDSRALEWMNESAFAAALEFCPGGLTVRIYGRNNTKIPDLHQREARNS